ncbi:MAG: hypothetical protein ACFFCI_01010 [Promethearchaeota archaeon]
MNELEQETLESVSGKYYSLVQFISVQNYLDNAMGSKNTKIPKSMTLIEKIKDKSLNNYLRGVELFFEYASQFKTPEDILLYYDSIAFNREKLALFQKLVDDYIIWLSKEKNYSDNTAQTYQAQLRGFLRWNFINIRFRNYESDSEKKKLRETLGIDHSVLIEMANRLRSYLSKKTSSDSELYLFTNWLHISGLGSLEILRLRFSDIRSKLLSTRIKPPNFIEISKRREKTNIAFTTFIYGEVKSDLIIFLRHNTDKEDKDHLFGSPQQAYDRLYSKFRLIVLRMIRDHYPEWLEDHKENSLFTFHTYRHIFITTRQILGIPDNIGQLFVAHKSLDTESKYFTAPKLLHYFKQIQKELFINLYPLNEV